MLQVYVNTFFVEISNILVTFPSHGITRHILLSDNDLQIFTKTIFVKSM